MANSPLSPSLLTLAPTGTTIHLSWDNNDPYGNAINIMRRVGSDPYHSVGSVYYPTDYYDDEGLSYNTEYYYYISVSGNDEFGNPYGPSNYAHDHLDLPAPTGLAAVRVANDNSVDLSWSLNATGCDQVRIQYCEGNTGAWSSTGVVGTATAANLSGLYEASLYGFRVAMYDAVGGYSEYSSVATATVDLIAPTGFWAQGSTGSESEADLGWSDNSSREHYYEVEMDGATAGTCHAGFTSYTQTGLTAGNTYVFRVRAVRGTTASDWSPTASARAGFVPMPPTITSLAASGPFAMDLEWEPTGSVYDGFYIYRSLDNIAYDFVTGTTAGATDFHDESLESWTKYWYIVAAYNESGESDSPATGATTDNDTNAPTGLALTVVSDTQIALSFTNRSTDVSYHKVMYRKSTEAWGAVDQTSITPPAVSITQGNLEPGTTYYFRVRDQFGSEYSAYCGETGASTLSPGTASTRRNETYFAFGNELCLTTDEPQGVRDIDCVWTSKPTDFSEQDQEAYGRFKTVEKVTLEYEDVYANTPVIVSLSIDNGITWTDAVAQGSTLVPATGSHAGYALLGTGNGAAKSADYWFAPASSKYFQVRVRSYDSATSFVWTGLYIHYRLHGPYFEAA